MRKARQGIFVVLQGFIVPGQGLLDDRASRFDDSDLVLKLPESLFHTASQGFDLAYEYGMVVIDSVIQGS